MFKILQMYNNMKYTEYVIIVAGGLTSTSLIPQVITSIKTPISEQQELNNTFLFMYIVGQVLWMFYAVELYIDTEGERGLVSIIWTFVAFTLMLLIILFRNFESPLACHKMMKAFNETV